jgi:deoxyribonucleoside regulator
LDFETHELLAVVASMYYEQDKTQTEIAEALGLSRVKVYRLLREAREAKIVQINIDWPIKTDPRLQDAMVAQFGLKDARVLRGSVDDQPGQLRQLGHMAARFIEPLLLQSTSMAICLGRTTYEVINAIRPEVQANVQVVQATGAMPSGFGEYDSSALARQLAEKLGGHVMYLAAPTVVDTPQAAMIIRRQRDIQHALTAARSANLALIGIGNLDANNSSFVRAGFLSRDELSTFKGSGAVGDVAWHIYSEDGQFFESEFSARVIGITPDDLKGIGTTIAAAAGLPKARAILGALRTGAIDVLCTDDRTARAVLRLADPNAPDLNGE